MRIKRSPAEYYLMDIRRLEITIQSINAELNDLMRSCGGLKGVSYDGISVQTTKSLSPLESLYISSHDRIDKLSRDLCELRTRRNHMIDQIRQMPNEDHANILALIFIDGKSWQSVIDKIAYSEDYCWKLRRKALNDFNERYLKKISNNNQ